VSTPRLDRFQGTVHFAARKSRTLEPLAFDEYCRFNTSAFFWEIKRGSLYFPKESRSIKTAILIGSLRFQRQRGRVNCQTRAGAPRARDAWRKFTEIYGNPRGGAARELCGDFLPVIGTVCTVRRMNRATIAAAAMKLCMACLVRSVHKFLSRHVDTWVLPGRMGGVLYG
jgi:hypothetical protein